MARNQDEETRPWKTSDPWISGILAYLIPGAGHLYQGRRFKALLYSVCILGTFFYGTLLADWKTVEVPREFARLRGRPGYIAQLGVGLPALTAIGQSMRYRRQLEALDFDQSADPDGFLRSISEPIDARFEGLVIGEDFDDPQVFEVEGRLELEPTKDDLGSPRVEGRLVFEDEAGKTVELALGGEIRIRPRIYSNRQRLLITGVVDEQGAIVGQLRGSIPRGFLDWYQVPLEPDDEQVLHQRLGKRLELALVYTWIAGFLNVLAIWDCVAGPAYGIGDGSDEENESGEKASSEEAPSVKEPAT